MTLTKLMTNLSKQLLKYHYLLMLDSKDDQLQVCKFGELEIHYKCTASISLDYTYHATPIGYVNFFESISKDVFLLLIHFGEQLQWKEHNQKYHKEYIEKYVYSRQRMFIITPAKTLPKGIKNAQIKAWKTVDSDQKLYNMILAVRSDWLLTHKSDLKEPQLKLKIKHDVMLDYKKKLEYSLADDDYKDAKIFADQLFKVSKYPKGTYFLMNKNAKKTHPCTTAIRIKCMNHLSQIMQKLGMKVKCEN